MTCIVEWYGLQGVIRDQSEILQTRESGTHFYPYPLFFDVVTGEFCNESIVCLWSCDSDSVQ